MDIQKAKLRDVDFTNWNLTLVSELDKIPMTAVERNLLQKCIDELERIFREANV